ncbi:MAG: DUF2065 domain-containing protein [Hyphomicrobiaceae bacterium]|nr:DUF2065 domain-containing protein [Hyphomicrobiaceae bacterium]
MNDLLAGLGLAIVLEGLLWAISPDLGRRIVRDMASLPERQLAMVAWTMVVLGMGLVWLARG